MKRIFAFLTLAAAMTATFPLAAEPAFAHKVAKVVAGYSDERSTLANFPVLVRIPAGTAAECRADGADIRFTSPDGETEYAHEIDAWNPDGESTVWVLLPEMQNGTSFIMEWGDPDYTGPETPWAKGVVWDPAGYAGVWHMTEETGNVANATSKTGMDAEIVKGSAADDSYRYTTAPIGFSRHTGAKKTNNATGCSYFRIPMVDLEGTFIVSGWMRMTDYDSQWNGNFTRNARIFSCKESWDKDGGGFDIAHSSSINKLDVRGSGKTTVNPVNFPNSTQNWVHYAFMFNGTSFSSYANGSAIQNGSGTIGAATYNGKPLCLGSGASGSDHFAVAAFDEVRLLDFDPDVNYADWIAAEYAMGADSAFLEDREISLETPVVSIAITSDTAREWHNESQTITLSRPGDSVWNAISVAMSYSGSESLVSGLPSAITIAAGQTTASLVIPVADNSVRDGDRSLTATVLAGAGYEVGATSSVMLTILDDETHAQVCNWTGSGDGTLWSDADNWSSHTVPTEIDTVVFGNGVSADLAVTFADGEPVEAKSVRFETPCAVTIGSAGGPSVPAIDFAVAEGAGTVTFGAEFVFSSAATITAAEETEIVFTKVSGTEDLILEGAGTVNLGSQDGTRTGGGTIVRGGILLVSNNKQLGDNLVIGGADVPAIVRSNNHWGDIRPFAKNNCHTEVLQNGFLNLASDIYSGVWAKDGTGPIVIHAGGSVSQGKRSFEFGLSTTNLFLEGSFEGGSTAFMNFKDGSWLVRPATATGPLTIPSAFNINTKVRFVAEDVPEVPVDLTLSGKIAYGWHPRDAFYKMGNGVLRLTGANTYGGGGSLGEGEGTTIIRSGTLLVDNETGSGTGNSLVTVEAGTVLGGTGRIGGLTETVTHWSGQSGTGENTCVTAKGTAEAQAVIAPGTIDDETGAHVIGTLTVGVEELHHPVTFGEYSSLAISAGREGADALVVHGTVDIAETGTQLVVAAVGDQDKVRSGTFTILEADEITGEFATVSKPGAGWRVSYESEEVDGQSVTKRVILTVPGAGTVMVFR